MNSEGRRNALKLACGVLLGTQVRGVLGASDERARTPRRAGRSTGQEAPRGPAQRVLNVGRERAIRSIAEASTLANSGDVIEVDAGTYTADVAVFAQPQLTIRARDPGCVLHAAGHSAEAKAIWVVRGQDITVEGFTFTGARVPDLNGAGIRHETGRLTVRNCTFTDNETGILTGNEPMSELEVRGCEFGRNGAGDGQSHNLYVGAIARVLVEASYFHHGNVGHLLKTRAAEAHILYNRLTDERDGTASYELEFPAGGIAYVIGNLIQQGPMTENTTVVSYGAEGLKWPRNELFMINNTLVNDLDKPATFLALRGALGRGRLINNVICGLGTLAAIAPGSLTRNFRATRDDFAAPARMDYRLRPNSWLVGRGYAPGSANGLELRPVAEYVHPRSMQPVQTDTLSPGAFQRTGTAR